MRGVATPSVAAPTWEVGRRQRRVLRSRFPSADVLMASLSRILPESFGSGSRLVALERQPNEYQSTFLSEVVTCRFKDGQACRVLVKYGLTDYVSGHGHRGGVAREALAYRRVLNPLGYRPRCYGTYENGSGESWLVLEFIEGVTRIAWAEEGIPVLALAARWSGGFHAATAPAVARSATSILSTYDGSYYAGWCERTSGFAEGWHNEFPWLQTLCERFSDVAGVVLSGQNVVVHGEYGPKNVLCREREMFPVDWESAAIGAGEVDLAGLTDGWPADLVDDAVTEYANARWPNGRPATFETRLLAARIYWNLRWLGDRPDWIARERYRARCEQLYDYGRRLEVI